MVQKLVQRFHFVDASEFLLRRSGQSAMAHDKHKLHEVMRLSMRNRIQPYQCTHTVCSAYTGLMSTKCPHDESSWKSSADDVELSVATDEGSIGELEPDATNWATPPLFEYLLSLEIPFPLRDKYGAVDEDGRAIDPNLRMRWEDERLLV